MLDADVLLFTITDLKQYAYCARILYYQACLPDVRPMTYKMQAGVDAHERERKRAERRSPGMYGDLDGEHRFDVPVQSAALGLTGQIDEVVITPTELAPVDYKLAQRVGDHFKLQLAAYALLLEETFRTTVRRGFIYLMTSRKTHEVKITPKLRQQVQQALAEMHAIVEREQMPAPTDWRQRCADCEFRRFCNDV
jgi:CRISPR-associated exonuclease Cas4